MVELLKIPIYVFCRYRNIKNFLLRLLSILENSDLKAMYVWLEAAGK